MERLLWLSVVLGSCLVTSSIHAEWAPRVTGLGEVGEYGSLWGDGLFPLKDVANQVVFFDFQAETNRFYSSNFFSGILSPGVGARHAFSNENVLGIYLFSDYMMTNVNQNYWLLSPGMDFYRGPVYVALNGYIPVNNAPRQIGPRLVASDLGMTQYETFVGHSQYDHFIQTFDSMRWGVDLTGGMLFGDKNEWGVKLGAYVYDAANLNTITGGRGEVDYYFNDSVALTLEERYDNVFHNQTLVGIKISFLGKENRGTVKTQLKAPIYRNLNINTTNAGTPIGQYQQATSSTYLIRDNITFVSNAPSLSSAQLLTSGTITGDGTYENPYKGLDQTIIDNPTTIKNNTIWVEGTGAHHPYDDATTLTLHTGQSINGRTNRFKLDAYRASTQPIFSFAPSPGTAALYIDNTNTLQNFIMNGNGSDGSIGIYSVGAGSNQTAVINGVTIGSTIANTGYTTALYNQGGHVSLQNATLYAVKDTVNFSGNTQPQIEGVFGIYNLGGSVTVANTIISARANRVSYDSTGDGGDLVGVFGVYNGEGSTTLTDSTVQATSEQVVDNRTPSGAITSSIIGAFGLYNTKGTLTVTGGASWINVTATGVDNVGYLGGQGLLDYVGAFGVYNDGGGIGNTATLNIKQAHLTTSATTVSESIFGFNDPAISAVGLWNNGHGGTATGTLEQGANVAAGATWQIEGATGSGSAVNSYGLYNVGTNNGIGSLTANGAIVTATEVGGDGSGAGTVAGVVNGNILSAITGSAVTVIKGGTRITATGTGQPIPVYGFNNNGSNDVTNGTSIEGGSILDSEGGAAGVSSAVYSSLGAMAIQGTQDQRVMLIANGDTATNNGVWSDNGATTMINYATINVGSSIGGYSLGVNNTSGSNTAIQNATVTVSSADLYAFGVYNDLSSTMSIASSIFNVSTQRGWAYGLWDDGGGLSITSPTTLYFNYDTLAGGHAAAFSSSGNYTGTSNVTCYSNGIPTTCLIY